ncbi:MAG: methyl-accepting chemotaxis sensory transducer [uncultured bacterium]|nr:MAG: methyl-accepting chemotaxis sensory transducer [uncultured bacterium]
MRRFQKIGMRVLLPAVSVTIIFSIVLFFIGSTVVNHLVEQNFDRMVQAKTAGIANNEKRIGEGLLTQASLFSREAAVLGAYETAHQGNLTLADDPQMELARKELYSYFATIQKGYRQIHDNKSLRLHFHVPPARSLLRLWDKDQHKSDDLSSFRYSVESISRDHQPIVGIEIGRGGFEIRGIVPVIGESGRYLGSVEALSSFDPVVKDSISNEKEYIAVYMTAANKSV